MPAKDPLVFVMHVHDSCRRIREYIIGARNIVMHAYEYLKPQLIRDMAEKDVPELLAQCLRILGDAQRLTAAPRWYCPDFEFRAGVAPRVVG